MSEATTAPLMLSVSGIRGIVGASMTQQVANDLAAAFGSHIKVVSGSAAPVFCIGRDSRRSGETLARAAVEGLESVGCSVIDLGIAATPTVAVMSGVRGAHAGIVVTASHNPAAWNGMKCLGAEGVPLTAAEMDTVARRFKERDIQLAARPIGAPLVRDDTADDRHVARVLAHVDPDPVRRATFKVVLDSINGAGAGVGRKLLEALGCQVIQINGAPTGDFVHEPEPTEANLGDLARRTAAEHAVCGFAQDPDADRLAIVDAEGTYLGEEYTLVLAARRWLDLHGGGPIVANLSSSRMIDDLAERYRGATVIRTPVGEAHVSEAMRAAKALIGGEGNGGVILPGVCWVRDSLSAMALALSLLAAEQRPLAGIVAELPRYHMVKARFALDTVGGADGVGDVIERTRAAFDDKRINISDGLRVDLDDGWFHLRPSNTEPIVRLIAEAPSRARAQALVDRAAAAAGLV
ncbi:MAG: phosphoglucosamine mutase [Planctomycetota bacterium]|jgi:phosphomannomutase